MTLLVEYIFLTMVNGLYFNHQFFYTYPNHHPSWYQMEFYPLHAQVSVCSCRVVYSLQPGLMILWKECFHFLSMPCMLSSALQLVHPLHVQSKCIVPTYFRNITILLSQLLHFFILEAARFEPRTSPVPSQYATNWAILAWISITFLMPQQKNVTILVICKHFFSLLG